MLEIIRDILIAAIVSLFGAMSVVGRGPAEEMTFKRVLKWWATFTILFAIFRILF